MVLNRNSWRTLYRNLRTHRREMLQSRSGFQMVQGWMPRAFGIGDAGWSVRLDRTGLRIHRSLICEQSITGRIASELAYAASERRQARKAWVRHIHTRAARATIAYVRQIREA